MQQNPRVLAIGDSIVGGWFPPIAYKGRDEFSFFRLTVTPESTWIENARNTNYTLRHLDAWLKQFPNNQVIIWNNGIWNCSTMVTPGEDPRNYGTPVSQYESEIVQIATRLKSAAPRVIFLTTTTMMPNDIEHKELQFNEVAKRVLPPLGVEIFDLYAFTIDHMDWHLDPTNVHYTGIANEYISDWILKNLRGTK